MPDAWRCDACEYLHPESKTPEECPECDVGPFGSWTGADLPEPTDDQIYNGFGMEGGIAYSTSGDMRDEHDPSL